MNFKEGDRVSFDYLTSNNEIIEVVGVVDKPSTGRPMIVKLDTPRKRADSPRPQTHITIVASRIQEKFALAS
jgi:hypothetical protein